MCTLHLFPRRILNGNHSTLPFPFPEGLCTHMHMCAAILSRKSEIPVLKCLRPLPYLALGISGPQRTSTMRVLQNCGDLHCCTSTKTTILWGPFLLPLPFPLPVFLFSPFPNRSDRITPSLPLSCTCNARTATLALRPYRDPSGRVVTKLGLSLYILR